GGNTFTPPNWPAFTIEAQRGNTLNVTYDNQLSGETYDKVGMVVDQTLHWADPLMTHHSMDPYAGEPPAVVHLHGGEVASQYDGGPDSWFTPGNAIKGPAWDFGVTNNYAYLNTQEAATLWYHDHALGVTRLNVYAGMAGYYFLRGPDEETKMLPGWSGDNKVQQIDRVTGQPVGAAYLPEIEIAIQDRMFDTNGKLYFPNLPTNPMIHPFWTPEFVGNIITVNGKTWPYLSVAPRKYRFRILNGSNARTYELWLQNLATGTFGPNINQIGTDGGLLDAPVVINPALGGKLILMPGERADVVIDFSTSPAGTVWTIRNSGRTPYPNGAPPTGSTLGRIMQFVVNGQLQGADNSQLPATLRATPLVKLTNFAGGLTVTPDKKRQLTLNEVMGMGGPLEVLVNNTKWDGNGPLPGLGVTETPTEGTSEVWQIINLTADAHPIHLHLVQFQLVSRQQFNKN
ncbi:MAG: multicopper oxidase domain-containing protein, partial [Ignavibacteria bacterium]|nr:multicopper oxidase domain-containing protein [Ignavibacteria bacterium]